MAEAAQKRRKDFHRSGVRAGPRLLRHRSKIRVGTKDRAVWGVLGPFSFAQSLNPPQDSTDDLGDTANAIFLLHYRGGSSWNIYCPTRKRRGEAGVGHSSAHSTCGS